MSAPLTTDKCLLRIACQEYLGRHAVNIDALSREEQGLSLAQHRARVLDGLLTTLFCVARATVLKDAPVQMALIAVGGYGRKTVAVHGSVRVVLLCASSARADIREFAEAILFPVWDLGMSVGCAVRESHELLVSADHDFEAATALLDMRIVAGDASLFESVRKHSHGQNGSQWQATLFSSLNHATQARHHKYGEAAFLEEPDLKLCPGGLCDLNGAWWAARARWSLDTWAELSTHGVLTQRDVEALMQANETLWQMRNALHRRYGRRCDRLLVSDQKSVAERLGCTSAELMARFRHARSTIYELSQQILSDAVARVH